MTESNKPSFQIVVSEDFALVNQCIHEQLHSDVALVSQIGSYITRSGGKRLRPLLVLLAAKATGLKGRQHIPLATIIEFLHTATLLHDDVVDESNLRRGQNTANALWGNAPSVLVGDFLYSRAFQMMVELDNMTLLKILSNATNVIAEGEVMQLMNINDPSVTEAHYMNVIRCKTAMLFEASTHTGAVLSGVNKDIEQAIQNYGHYLGLAFQLIDDLLDYEGDTKTMGKNLGDDLAEGKPTLPLIFTMAEGTPEEKQLVCEAIEQSDSLNRINDVIHAVRRCGALDYTAQRARAHSEKAISCLQILPHSPYKEAMEDLARFSVNRTY